MRPAVKWGLALGAAVAVQYVVFGALGWHTISVMAFVFLAIAVVLDVAAVVLCLRQTARDTAWPGQVANAVVVGAVGSVLIFASSWFVSTVVFPDYYLEMAEGYRPSLVQQGMTTKEVNDTVERIAATSPVRSALEAVVGTLVTSLLAGAVAGIWLRRRE